MNRPERVRKEAEGGKRKRREKRRDEKVMRDRKEE